MVLNDLTSLCTTTTRGAGAGTILQVLDRAEGEEGQRIRGGGRPEPRDLEQLLDTVERPRLAAGESVINC